MTLPVELLRPSGRRTVVKTTRPLQAPAGGADRVNPPPERLIV